MKFLPGRYHAPQGEKDQYGAFADQLNEIAATTGAAYGVFGAAAEDLERAAEDAKLLESEIRQEIQYLQGLADMAAEASRTAAADAAKAAFHMHGDV